MTKPDEPVDLSFTVDPRRKSLTFRGAEFSIADLSIKAFGLTNAITICIEESGEVSFEGQFSPLCDPTIEGPI